MTMRPIVRHVARTLERLVHSERAAVAPLIGLLMLVLVGSIGLAIDGGRAVLVRARLADALDAAGLAVGARLSTTDYSADALKFVQANFSAGYAGATVSNVTATPDSTKSVISLTATATMPTIFMQLFGHESVTVNATSEITRQSTGLEVALVLDNTLSMSGSINSLKSASNALLDVLFGSQTVGKNLYVGLVPFSQAVNVNGAQAVNWTTSSSNWSNTTCVEERYTSSLDQKDDAPTTTATKFVKLSSSGTGYACPQKMLPMTNVKADVVAAIKTMTATGYTHVNVGAVWGWRMLSPKWRGYWSGGMKTYSLPLDYGTPHMSKAVVLMTDGENTFYSNVYTAYQYLSSNKLGTTNQSKAETELGTRLKAVCASMKAAGITIFTVAFNSPGATIKAILDGCATSGTAIEANDSTIKAKFQEIGGALSNLRVSK